MSQIKKIIIVLFGAGQKNGRKRGFSAELYGVCAGPASGYVHSRNYFQNRQDFYRTALLRKISAITKLFQNQK